ncbi:MAG TPA: beta-N-acetylhexosaminidase [Longimicrobiaceae bacterium]|nr:beta-N-acetylhexosaminidase [Longimicrobiaceae bacterium]
MHTIIPQPASVEPAPGDPFTLTAATRIGVEPGSGEVAGIGEYLAAILRPSTGFPLPVSGAGGGPAGGISLRITADTAGLGEEGYRLEVTRDSVTLRAARPAGLFRGVQTLRHLLPPGIEAEQSVLRAGAWTVPAGVITDRPRFAWRGAMLDVARHFFTVDEVKQYIDALALYKLNVLHLHLSDDQGWRIEIRSRPRLATVGGSTQVGGGPGGFYTQEEYAGIVRYAGERYITVVPEIDLPGHTNAALVAYPELSCSRRPPALYTGIEVGFSALCPDREDTYRFVEDVVRELAALTPGPYLHVGGDEVEALCPAAYAGFVERVQGIVARYGKRMVGWEEIAKARLLPTTLVQQWRSDSAAAALRHGARLILSPASRVYLDMKYTPRTELGLNWAGHVEVRDAYDWDPATFLEGVSERDVAGVEAPLWSETLENLTAAQYLAFPRLPAVAEVGWTPGERKGWEGFRLRLAAQAPRWHLLGVNYHRSPQIPWPE